MLVVFEFRLPRRHSSHPVLANLNCGAIVRSGQYVYVDAVCLLILTATSKQKSQNVIELDKQVVASLSSLRTTML